MKPLGEFVLRRALVGRPALARPLSSSVNLSPVQVRDPALVDLVARCAGANTAIARLAADAGGHRGRADRQSGGGQGAARRPAGARRAARARRFRHRLFQPELPAALPASTSSRSTGASSRRSAAIANSQAVIQAIVALGRALGLTLLAEGVETEEQRVLLRLAGCEEMQGFLFARPGAARGARPPAASRAASAGPARLRRRRLSPDIPPPAALDTTRKPRCPEQRMIPNAWQGFDFGLGEDVDMLRDTARGFAQDKIAPRADEIDKTNTFPRDLWPQMGALGLLGITVEEEWGGAGHGLSRPLRRDGGGLARLGFGRPVLRRAFQSLRQPDPAQRQRRAAQQIPAQADLRRACRRARDVRARRRLRRGVDAHPRREEGRPLRPQRLEVLDHQRAGGRDARGLRQDRSGRRRRAASPPS